VPGGLDLRPNRQAPSRGALGDLVATKEMGAGFVALALLVAAGLGAFHALEPGHGKTVVAAYLVGSRGTVWHALWLGLIVTGAHTAGVYLLGVVTLYASRYVVPERLYPWLGVVSGLIIAGVGFTLFLRRYAAPAGPHGHGHPHEHGHGHGHGHAHDPAHGHEHGHSHVAPADATGRVSVSGLVALGVGGGIIPCPAALVVLLTAVSLNRIGFGFLLIVAFSVGLAAVLVVVGVLMVQARRVMARFGEGGPLIQRWLPLTSSAVMTLLGIGIAIQALVAAGILQIRL
jgi:ABC-type nickel/cobalt efflux system permease component RcnA